MATTKKKSKGDGASSDLERLADKKRGKGVELTPIKPPKKKK